MNSSKILITLLLFVFAATLNAQELTQTIKGSVVDKESQFPLIGVTIQVLESSPIIATMTDYDGNFRLENVPVGRQSIQISYIGYEPVVMNNLMLTSGKELDIKIQLVESIQNLDKVEIVAQKSDKRQTVNKMATVSTRTFSVEEAGRYSGTLQDPARMAQNYAGVSGSSDDRNDIIIRGNSPLGVLWRMEGIDIPSPNHFSTLGTTGGPISMLNINNLANSDFATSAWSADYGNALSGVFDLSLRNGNTDKREYLGQIGFNGFEFGAEGPFKAGGRSSYMLNYRYSTLGVLSALGLDVGTGDAIPNYQDLTFKLNFPMQNASKLSVWGIMGVSDIDFDADQEAEDNLFSPNNEESYFESNTLACGITHQFFFDEKTYLKSSVAYSYSDTRGYIDRINFETSEAKRIFGADRRQAKISGSLKLNHKLNSKNNFAVGVIGDQYFINTLDSNIVDLDLPEERMILISDNEDETAFLTQSYINWQHKFNDLWTLNAGFHTQHFLLSESNSYEPRLGIKYQVNEKHVLSGGVGMHSQIQPITVYFVDEYDSMGNQIGNPNMNLDFSKAFHSVLAHDFFIRPDMRIKTEVYYQYLYNIPVEAEPSSFSMLNQGADFIIPTDYGYVNEGTGSNIGMELTVEKFYTKGYYFLLTASVFDSKYKGSDGVERNTVFNSNSVVNVLGGKEFTIGKRNIFSVDAKFTYSGGRRYTPIDTEASASMNREVRIDDEAFALQYDPYIRGDIKLSWRRNGDRISQIWSLDIQNVTDNDNVFLTQYDRDTNSLVTQYQRGFFPMFLYQIYF